jgi:hypothetical protein
MTKYNGWTNKETWLVNVHWMYQMPEHFAEREQFEVTAEELEEEITYITEECEALSQVEVGLLADFIRDAWNEVDWYQLAEHLNRDLATLEAEA